MYLKAPGTEPVELTPDQQKAQLKEKILQLEAQLQNGGLPDGIIRIRAMLTTNGPRKILDVRIDISYCVLSN